MPEIELISAAVIEPFSNKVIYTLISYSVNPRPLNAWSISTSSKTNTLKPKPINYIWDIG